MSFAPLATRSRRAADGSGRFAAMSQMVSRSIGYDFNIAALQNKLAAGDVLPSSIFRWITSHTLAAILQRQFASPA
jgi:hypothetical protein